MTTVNRILLGVVVYLVVGIILKNHTRIGTVQFKDHSTRFVFFYILPLGGLAFYVVGIFVYFFIMYASSLVFGQYDTSWIDEGKFFPEPNLPEYPPKA